MTDPRRVLVLGATGYVGGRLVPRLLDAGWQVRCLTRAPVKIAGRTWGDRVEVVVGDLSRRETLRDSLRAGLGGVVAVADVSHALPASAERGCRIARVVAELAAQAGVRRIVRLACLAASERADGPLLDGPVPATLVRAAPIMGAGSAAFDALRHLAAQPVVPRLTRASVAPVAIDDVVRCLVGALDETDAHDHLLAVAGPDALTFRRLLEGCARVAGPTRRVVVLPVPSPWLAGVWTSLVTPVPLAVAVPLVRSLAGASGRPAATHADYDAVGYEAGLRDAVADLREGRIETSWRDAGPLPEPHPGDHEPHHAPHDDAPERQPHPLRYTDVRTVAARATPESLLAVVCAVGGDAGWPTHRWAWGIRGLLDRLIGGVGLSRGRRLPHELRVGDALDFWRVEELRPPGPSGDGVLRLAAEMWLPGRAWLEWRIQPGGGDRGADGALLVQRAVFLPTAVLGRLCWAAMRPFHGLIFGSMARALARRAQALDGLTNSGAPTAPPWDLDGPPAGSGPREPPARRAG